MKLLGFDGIDQVGCPLLLGIIQINNLDTSWSLHRVLVHEHEPNPSEAAATSKHLN